MDIGRRIYYEKATGNVIQNTGERSGNVVETTVEQDFEAYAALAERVPEIVGMVQLDYGQYAQDFAECSSFRVNVSQEPHTLEFAYPDPDDPEAPPVYRAPLSVEVDTLKAENEALKQRVLIAEQASAEISATQEMMIELLIEGGII